MTIPQPENFNLSANNTKRDKFISPHLEAFVSRLDQERTIAYHPKLAKFTGSIQGALILRQLIYLDGKGIRKDGFIWKSDREWSQELQITRHSVRDAIRTLQALGILHRFKGQAQGSPTNHYRIDTMHLNGAWSRFTRSTDIEWTAYIKEQKRQFISSVKKKATNVASNEAKTGADEIDF
jgi:hypothetical protein